MAQHWGPLVLGGNVFGWTADASTSHAVLDAFIEGGGRMIDTADVYSVWVPGHTGGESESIIGGWLAARRRRDDVFIATKVGMEIGGSRGLASERIAASVEGSLRRLRTDYVDLYYAHTDDAEVPLEETLTAFDRLVKSGKVRAIGASNYNATRLEHALAVSAQLGLTAYTVLQPNFNLVNRSVFEPDLQRVCVSHDIAAVPYYGLASGFLTGKYRRLEDLAGKARGAGAGRYMNAHGLAVLQAMDAVVAETGATHAQVALAWLAVQPGVAAPIASATSVKQVQELLGAAQVRLTARQLARLDAVSRDRLTS